MHAATLSQHVSLNPNPTHWGGDLWLNLPWDWGGPCPLPSPPPPNLHKKPFSIQKFFRPPLIELPSSKFYSFCFVFFFLLLCPFLCLFNRSGLVHLIFISCFIRLAHMTVINDESNFYNPSHITVLIPPPSGHVLSF